MVRGFETGGNQLSDNITLLDTSTASEKRHSTDSNCKYLCIIADYKFYYKFPSDLEVVYNGNHLRKF